MRVSRAQGLSVVAASCSRFHWGVLTCSFHLISPLQSNKGEVSGLVHQLQEKERLLTSMKEAAAAAKERCEQLTQVKTHRFRAVSPQLEAVGDLSAMRLNAFI